MIRQFLSSHTSSPRVQFWFAHSRNRKVRISLAKSSKLLPTVQMMIAVQGDPYSCLYLAGNAKLEPIVASILAKKDDPNILYALIKNPHTPKECLETLKHNSVQYIANSANIQLLRQEQAK